MVVDDVTNVALTFGGLIRSHGQRTQVVYSGEHALQVACEFRTQILFIDIGLPEMVDYELARWLRAIDGLAGSLLISVSGSAGDPERFRQAGLNHRLTKPVALDALIGILDQQAKLDFAR